MANKEINVARQLTIAIPELVLGSQAIIVSYTVGKALVDGVPDEEIYQGFIQAHRELPIPAPDTFFLPAHAVGMPLPLATALLALASVTAICDGFRRLSLIKDRMRQNMR